MNKVLGKYLGSVLLLLTVIVLLSIGAVGSAQAYETHSPILIFNNTTLVSAGFPGTGTEADPFLIQNYGIDGAGGSAIEIYNTDLHIKIQFCLLSYSSSPFALIHLENVQNVTIENNTLVTSYVGINLFNSNNIVIRNNIFEDYNTGIRLESSDNNVLFNNTCVLDVEWPTGRVGIRLVSSDHNRLDENNCSGNNDGIYLRDSNYNTLVANTCDDNDGDGISIDSSINNTVTANICRGNSIGGIVLYSSSSASTGSEMTSNTCSGNGLVLSYGAGILLSSSATYPISNNNISDNDLRENYYGISLLNSPNNIVASNVVHNNIEKGIYLYDSDHNNLFSNDIQRNLIGIFIDSSSYNYIANNNCNDHVGGKGIQLFTSSFNTLFNNTANGNSDGISIFSTLTVYSTDNVIHNNTCNGNTNDGIFVQDRSGYTTLTNNTCNGNANRGVEISASSYCVIANNTSLRNVDGLYISAMNIGNVIDNNDFSDNTRYGMYLSESTGSSVTNNTCVGNAQIGIRVNNFHSGSIVNNSCNENGVGIYLTSSNDNQVMNNNCSLNTADPGSNYGIWLTSSHRNTIANNTCDQNGESGIYLGYSNDNVLTNNSCSGNPNAGVFLYYADATVLYNNTLNGNAYGIRTDHSYDLVIVENEIHENANGMYLYGADGSDVIGNNCTAASLMYYQTYGIFLKYSTSVMVLDNDCNYNYVGIMNEDSDDIVISNNNCDLNFQTGIELRWALGNLVSDNSCTGNSIGMTVIASEGNTISDNNCSGNVQAGINFYNGDSPNNVISNNTFNDNGYGMWLESIIDSRVSNNTCEDNGKAGIRIAYRCKYNVIENNTIVNNGYLLEDDGYGMWSAGIGLAIDGSGEYNACDGNIIANNTIEGSRLYGLQILSSFGIRVFGNVFVGNNGTTFDYDPAKVQAYDDSNNFWNDTDHGNTWGDWTSPDANGDGIVDEAYVIDGGTSKDLLPLAISLVITSPADGLITGAASVDLLGIAVSYFGVDQVVWYNAATGGSGICTGTEAWSATVALAEGSNFITVTMTNLQGWEVNGSITVILDATNPDLVITSPAEGSFTGGSGTIIWNASDADSGIAYYNISLDGGAWTTTTESSLAFTDLSAGAHTVVVAAFDHAGNYIQRMVNFTVDLTAPTVSISSPADGLINTTGSITVTWVGSDVGSGVSHYEVRLDGGSTVTLLPSVDSYTFTSLSDGSHVLTVTVYDHVGLYSSDTVTVTVDTQPPSLTITSPVDGGFLANSDVTVTWTGSDAGTGVAYYIVSIEGMTPINTTGGSYTFNSLDDGVYTVMVSAYDGLGNYRDEVATFTVDTVAPTLTIVSPAEGQLFNVTSVTIAWTTHDANPVTVRLSFDGSPWETVDGAQVVRSLASGSHIVRVNVTDQAGNFNESSVQFAVDTDAPTVTIVSPAPGSYLNAAHILLEWEASDPTTGINSTLVRLDGGAWRVPDAASSTNYSLEDGPHTLEVKVTDHVGNSATATVNFTVDTVAPTAVVSPTGTGLDLGQVIIVEFSEEMNQTSVIIAVTGVNGTMVWNGTVVTFTPSALHYNSAYNVTLSGRDMAGNLMEVNWTFVTRSVGNLTGVVLDENGDPIAGAIVTAGGELTATTDADGRFLFVNLSVGTYMVDVEKDGYETLSFNATVVQGVTADTGSLELVPENSEEDGDDGSFWMYAIIAMLVLAVVGVGAFIFLRKK